VELQAAGASSPFLNMVTMQLELMLQTDAGGIDAAGEQIKAAFPGLTSDQETLIDEAVDQLILWDSIQNDLTGLRRALLVVLEMNPPLP